MDITAITAKTALVRSEIPGVDFVVNPYLGCGHGCLYCYAVFMRKYSRHHSKSPWGSFVEAKVNIAEVSEKSQCLLIVAHLPGAKVIGSGVGIPDMIWIWGVFGALISFGP
jgi:hypothetical protein